MFQKQVYDLMRQLPDGLITTYGDIAAFAGSPRAARIVGGIAHRGDDSLPWHRLVNREGGLAIGFPGGHEVQRQLLEQEGIACDDSYHVVQFSELRWRPDSH